MQEGQEGLFNHSMRLKCCTDVASNLLVNGLRLNIRIPCDSLQQKFQHAEYFNCDPLIFSQFYYDFQKVFTVCDCVIIISIR